MDVRARAIYPPEASAVAAARHDVRESLEGAGLHDAVPLVCLLTSELVTNAVRHARTSLVLTIEWDGERLLVEVEDRGEGEPVPQVHPRDEPGGFGLVIVSEMATRWGHRRGSPLDGGKIVWFELAADAFSPAWCTAAS